MASHFVEADKEFLWEIKKHQWKQKRKKEEQTTGLTFFNDGQRWEETTE